MFKTTVLFISLTFCSLVNAQNKPDLGVLKKSDEQVIFSFKLKGNNKIVVLCRQKNNKYLVYRFGTADKTELQYPKVLNAASWKLFKYSGYSRGGGVQNEATEQHSISFINSGIAYFIYNDWDSIEGKDAGIVVKINKKETKLIGNTLSETGTLGVLRDYENLIQNTYLDNEK